LAKARLAKRLGRTVSAIGGYYSRGGGDATPLALPELLKFLVSRLQRNGDNRISDFVDGFFVRSARQSA
jgi:hypothetical protein